LIHQKRRQYSDAIDRFNRSVEIDPNEIDAHYQLGRIAREQKRFQDAISHFDAVVTRDEKHCRYEIWREIGATYFEAGMCEDARPFLERYVQQREFDPEGLYFLGASYAGLGLREQARQALEQCLEAVRTTPHYRRGEVRHFQKLANEKLAGLA
jgi:tetratricopeptide (TPR) repeat protein